MLGPGVMHTSGGIVDASKLVSEPPPVQIEPEAPAATFLPDAVIGGDFSRPRGVAVDKQGNIYVADRGDSRIVVYSPDGKVIHTWGKAGPAVKDGEPPPALPPGGGVFSEILDVAVGDDGTVYVFDNTPRVQAFSPSGEFKGSIEPGDLALYAPNGISAAPPAQPGQDAGILVAVTGQSRVLRLPAMAAIKSGQATASGNSESITVGQGDSLEQPVDVVADPTGSGMIYVIDLKDRILQLKPPDATKSETTWSIGKQWRVPVGRDDGGSRLAISPDGKQVYMSDPDRKRVAVLEVATGKITYFGGVGHDAGQFSEPLGIAVGPDGRVYVLDRDNNNVQVFNLSNQQ
jgi:DNA-binding beta-propeller fold protein YncE